MPLAEGKGALVYRRRESDLSRFTRRFKGHPALVKNEDGRYPHSELPKRSYYKWLNFPFASMSVLIVLSTLFAMSMIFGGWTWSSWTYALSFTLLVPLILLERFRKAVITGGALILLLFMVIVDAGMPGYFGYNPSDLNWYDNLAHYLGALGVTMFLWAFLWWTISPTGPPNENGHRKFVLTIAVMLVISVFFEFTEFFSDILFGWTNFHPGIDTVGDLIFDIAGVLTAGFVIARHKYSPLKRPFWHADSSPA